MGGMNIRHLFLLNIIPGKYFNGEKNLQIFKIITVLLLHEHITCRARQNPGISAWNSVDSNVSEEK